MQAGAMTGERILLVDDHQESVLFLADSVLRPQGYEVLTATNGKEGLELAQAELPDLIVMGIQVPGINGLEVMAELHGRNVDIPVILTTFHPSEESAVQAFQLGAKGYLVHPHEAEAMLNAVDRALAEPRLRREQESWRQNAKGRHHLEARVRGLHSLCNIGRAMMGLDQVEEVARVAVDAAVHTIDGEAGELFLISQTDQRVRKRATRGASDSQARMVRLEETDPQVEKALTTAQTVVEEQSDRAGAEPGTRLVVPLRRGETVLGALAVRSRSRPSSSDNDQYHLSILAGFAAEAVVNARAITDLQVRLADLQMVSDLKAEVARLPPSAVSDLQHWIATLEQVAADAKALIQALMLEG
jgi:CheY-like chemotaxis protein